MRLMTNLVVCGGCRLLVDRTGQFAWPGCACRPMLRQGPDYEPGKAFLCKCCAAAVLEDSHRWITFFCRSCAGHVVALNRAVGWPLITYAKHSIVNGVFVRGSDPQGPATLSAALRRTAAGVAVLDRWVDARVTKVLAAMGRADSVDVPVVDYLAWVDHGAAASRQAFTALCDHIGANADLGG